MKQIHSLFPQYHINELFHVMAHIITQSKSMLESTVHESMKAFKAEQQKQQTNG